MSLSSDISFQLAHVLSCDILGQTSEPPEPAVDRTCSAGNQCDERRSHELLTMPVEVCVGFLNSEKLPFCRSLVLLLQIRCLHFRGHESMSFGLARFPSCDIFGQTSEPAAGAAKLEASSTWLILIMPS